MPRIKFANDVSYSINEGASLSNITIPAGEADIEAVRAELSVSANLAEVYFIEDDESVSGSYTNLVWKDSQLILNEDESITFGLREKTETELRLDALEESQEVQDEAIVEIAEILGGE